MLEPTTTPGAFLSLPVTIDISFDGEFLDSTPDLDRGPVLAQRYAKDGYLYLRAALDPKPLLSVRDKIVDVLVSEGMAEAHESGPRWSGADPASLEELLLYEPRAELDYLEESEVASVIERAWGHAPLIWRSVAIFSSFPDDSVFVKGPHQDRFFPDDEADGFATAWLPLTVIDNVECGGLAIAAGSHRRGRLEERVLEDMKMRSGSGPVRALRAQDVEDPWLSASMNPGDMLIFHSLAVHSGLANFSNRVRLALALRFQRQDIEASPLSRHSKLENASRRAQVKALMKDAGLPVDRLVLFKVDDEIVKRRLEPSPQVIESIYARLGQPGA